jgi:hypothetical protein
VSSAADLNFPSFSRTECGLSSSFFQVIVVGGRSSTRSCAREARGRCGSARSTTIVRPYRKAHKDCPPSAVYFDRSTSPNLRWVPIDAGADQSLLETTVYRPSGPGPFSLVTINHGKPRCGGITRCAAVGLPKISLSSVLGGFCPGAMVRTRLAAGGRRIRTAGPTYAQPANTD